MAGIRKKANSVGKFQAWYFDYTGKRKFFMGTRNRAESLKMAQKLEDDHRQVRLGYRPVSTKADKAKSRSFAELRAEYIAWGNSKGGRNGMPWGDVHARMRDSHLKWWEERLDLKVIGDLEGILPKVEAALREVQAVGRSGKTLQNYSEALSALCHWAVERGYLAGNPLKRLSSYDTKPHSNRRALTVDEVNRLLKVAPPARRLLYEVALCTGLRAKELQSLKVGDINPDFKGLNLHARWTKNRKQGIQPIPQWLLLRLIEHSKGRSPDEPLLYVPSHPARELAEDMTAAGIPKKTGQGKVDFHSLRVAFITRIVEAGASVKEAQTLARHSNPELTMNIYAKTSPARLMELTEKISEQLAEDEACAPCVHQENPAEEFQPKKTNEISMLSADCGEWRRRESNPKNIDSEKIQSHNNSLTNSAQNIAISNAYMVEPTRSDCKSTTPSERLLDPSLHGLCALCVHQNGGELPIELALLIEIWPNLSSEVKEKIFAIIRKEKVQ